MKRILIVDDSAGFLSALWAILTSKGGLDVSMAYSGEEFLRIHEIGGPFDHIFIDVRMPGMTGVEAVSKMTPSETEKVTFMTGGQMGLQSPEVVQLKERGYNITGVLRKPFRYESVLEAMK
jgi:CheY-like chemotaxis protein